MQGVPSVFGEKDVEFWEDQPLFLIPGPDYTDGVLGQTDLLVQWNSVITIVPAMRAEQAFKNWQNYSTFQREWVEGAWPL